MRRRELITLLGGVAAGGKARPGVTAAVRAAPAWLARTQEKRKNSRHFESHPGNPG